MNFPAAILNIYRPSWIDSLPLCAIQSVVYIVLIWTHKHTLVNHKPFFYFVKKIKFWRPFWIFGNHLELIHYILWAIHLASVNIFHSIILIYKHDLAYNSPSKILHCIFSFILFNLFNFGCHFEFLAAILNWQFTYIVCHSYGISLVLIYEIQMHFQQSLFPYFLTKDRLIFLQKGVGERGQKLPPTLDITWAPLLICNTYP